MGYGKIYNTTWWGNALDTARTAGTEPDFFGSQMKLLTSNQPELVTNGDFATDSDWNKGSNWTINEGSATSDGTVDTYISQNIVNLDLSKTYQVKITCTNYTSGSLLPKLGSSGFETYITSEGSFTYYGSFGNDGTIRFYSSSFIGSIDNVSVKVARLELDQIEAKKCLADWIHVTALQDLNN